MRCCSPVLTWALLSQQRRPYTDRTEWEWDSELECQIIGYSGSILIECVYSAKQTPNLHLVSPMWRRSHPENTAGTNSVCLFHVCTLQVCPGRRWFTLVEAISTLLDNILDTFIKCIIQLWPEFVCLYLEQFNT